MDRLRGLILPVGISPEPIVYSLQQLQPQYVAVVVTPDSKRILEDVFRQFPLSPLCFRQAEVEDSPRNIGRLVLEVYELYRWLVGSCGLQRDEVAIDPTPGRKWMSAGVTMLASQLGLEMFYVDVRFDRQTRQAIPESMRLIQLGNAFQQTGFLAAEQGRAYFNQGHFPLAAQAWEGIRAIRSQEYELYLGLARLARTLHAWDLFKHYGQSLRDQFQQALDHLQRYFQAVSPPKQLLEFAHRIHQLADAIEEVSRATKPDLRAVADLLVNARRRIQRGQFDDATARLYRALEAVAQYQLLRRHGLDVSSPCWNTQSPGLRQAALEVFDGELPEQLGLYQAWALLWALKDPLTNGIVFPGRNRQGLKCNFRFHSLLERRNKSILAHGWVAVEQDDVCRLAEQVQEALAANKSEIRQWIARLQVPPLPELPLTRPDP